MVEITAVSITAFFMPDANWYFASFRYIDPETGRRSDTAHHFIYNQIDTNDNLKVCCGKRVVRILFE